KGYRRYLTDQDLLLPPSLGEWVAEEHLVYFVSDVVDQLDLSAIHAVYGDEKRGQPPYDPRVMTKLLVYGYCTGVFSSRRIQKRLQEDIPFRVLAAGNEPDFRTISALRKIHMATMPGLFEEVQEEMRRRETRLAKIKLTKTVVEQGAREKAVAEGKSAGADKRARPDYKDQYNFTDPESRIMKGAHGFVQGYNAQASVEPEMLL